MTQTQNAIDHLNRDLQGFSAVAVAFNDLGAAFRSVSEAAAAWRADLQRNTAAPVQSPQCQENHADGRP